MPVDRQRLAAAWGDKPPRYIQILADACDRDSQRKVADRLGKSSGYISRVLYNNYAGSMAEAEKQILAAYTGDRVECLIWPDPIPRASCLRNRRRAGPPRNQFHITYDRVCPTCPMNEDRMGDAE
jgi:hypothetical protein